jgi:hypothetical protein
MINLKHKIIGLYGNRGVGKDTLYKYIVEAYSDIRRADFSAKIEKTQPIYFPRLAFADELKNDLNPISQKMFKKNVHDLSAQEKEIFRPILIAYGCAWREVDSLHWVKSVDQQIQDMKNFSLKQVAFITDVRFPNEAEFFKKKYKDKFLLIGLNRKGAPTPTDEEKKHIKTMKKACDIFINMKNDPSLEYTKELAKYLLGISPESP